MSGAGKSGLDRLDQLVLNLLQDGFPIVARPYRDLASRLSLLSGESLSEDELFNRVNSLRDRGHLRRLGAILNSGPLGYRSTLCAAKVSPEALDAVADLIGRRPEVTHNYVRDDDLNVWFTFCHRERGGLEAFLGELRAVGGLDEILELPARKVYKIRAVFDIPVAPADAEPPRGT